MQHHDVIVFALQVGAMLTAALVCGQIMRALRQPAVLGELLGGILLGPTVLGTLAPHVYAWLFPATGAITVGRDAMLKIGMLFFMFVGWPRGQSSLSTKTWPKRRWYQSPGYCAALRSGPWDCLAPAGRVGCASSGAPPALCAVHGGGLIHLSPASHCQNFTGSGPDPGRDRCHCSGRRHHRRSLGWSLFAMLLGAFGKYSTTAHLGTMLGAMVGCATLIVGLGWWRGRALLQWARVALAWPSGFIGLLTIIVLLAAALAEAIGMHAIFGAFFVGVALGRAFGQDDQHVHEIIYQFAISFFAPLYFVSIGLKADFAAHFDLPLVLIVFVIACAGKIGGASLGAWLGGMPRQEALAVGFGMNARGAMEMILASVALEYQVIDQRIFVALITMALTTSMLSGPVMQRLLQKTSCQQP